MIVINNNISVFSECKLKLIKMKEERLKELRGLDFHLEVSGDIADIAKSLEDQHIQNSHKKRLVMELKEVVDALRRFDEGSYGVCEETEEPIEEKRLLAIPWTRLSLEGAEIRERSRKIG